MSFAVLAREDFVHKFWSMLEEADTPDDFAHIERMIRRAPRWIMPPSDFETMHRILDRREHYFDELDKDDPLRQSPQKTDLEA